MSDMHKPLPVLGYQAQDGHTIATVNDNKIAEEQLLRALDEMRSRPDDFDPRWTSIARTHIEQGFMAMNRAVFRPARIDLDAAMAQQAAQRNE